MSTLILGCGKNHVRKDGEVLVDRLPLPGIDYVHDLDFHPWPFMQGNVYDRIEAIHVVEHLRSLLIPFLDSCWYLLKPQGILHIETPVAFGDPDLEWCDPTHIRCYRPHSFLNYFTPHGIAKFGYTNFAWEFDIQVDAQKIMQVRAVPLK